jgi:outer membrane protein assembly factor BamB
MATATAQASDRTSRKPLRLWPGVLAVALQWPAWFLLPVLAPAAALYGVLAGVFGGFVVVLWWLCFSRAPWSERVSAIVLMIVGLFATSRIVHESIATGMMGMMLPIYAIPILSFSLVAWAVASRGLSTGPRRATLVASVLLACGVFTLLRTGGMTADSNSDLHWRWTQTPEERLLAQAGDEPLAAARGGPAGPSSAPAAAETPDYRRPEQPGDEPAAPTSAPAASETPEKPIAPSEAKTLADGPGFRGAERDGITRGVRIDTDWSRKPPVELWRRPIGPGWSSFAVRGTLVYTQEQRGDDEIVSAYDLHTGEPVWRHRDTARFWESNAGAGPRGTPSLGNGRLYTFGATGILNALDAGDGKVIWSRNAASDTGKSVPDWGFSSSPLVTDEVVIVGVDGQLVAYDLATGEPRWFGPAHGGSYSSPHPMTLDGVAQILQPSDAGLTSVEPANGTLLWEHRWAGSTILQPARTSDGDVLISTLSGAGGAGTRRIVVTHSPGGWTAEERWTSTGLKPYFNDFVVHNGYAFGFDGSILACIDLEDGTRQWKGGRYGHGQLVLLPDQDLLLVLSEEGELALVAATHERFTELARFPAIEGKTWNHPVLAGDVLLVRNDQEMAAFG